jgi:Domain of unknown function (DUF4263)
MVVRNVGTEKSRRSGQRSKSGADRIRPTPRRRPQSGKNQKPREVTVKEIWDGFVELMEGTEASEEDFHQYMVRCPALIPALHPQDNVVYSKFKIGSQHVADFAFCRDDSPGLRWHFIEIEKPKDRLFNKAGDPAARLSHALRQLHDWGAWFQENRDHVAKYFPHAERVRRFGLADPSLTLIIGRRQEIGPGNRSLMREIGGKIGVRTFDSLRNNLRTAWYDDDDRPLRCCTPNGTSVVELSRMKIDIRYRMG